MAASAYSRPPIRKPLNKMPPLQRKDYALYVLARVAEYVARQEGDIITPNLAKSLLRARDAAVDALTLSMDGSRRSVERMGEIYRSFADFSKIKTGAVIDRSIYG